MTAASQFIQIAAGSTGLHALDTVGRIWRYVPARDATVNNKMRYAFWTQLTDERAGTAEVHRSQ